MEVVGASVEDLCNNILNLSTESEPLWIGICGKSGSGKTTVASALQHFLPKAVTIPLDGFLMYRSELKSLPDPELASAMRGAYWTYNVEKLSDSLSLARRTGKGSFPTFDHAINDPVEDTICVSSQHKYVIVEGNYLHINESSWNKIRNYFDVTIFLECSTDIAQQRLIERHMECFQVSADDAAHRVDRNVALKAACIEAAKQNCDWLVHSDLIRINF